MVDTDALLANATRTVHVGAKIDAGFLVFFFFLKLHNSVKKKYFDAFLLQLYRFPSTSFTVIVTSVNPFPKDKF